MSQASCSPGQIASLRRRVLEEFDRRAPQLQRLGRDIHLDPELGCREFHTVTRLSGELEEEGLSVETGIAGMATAFRAEARSDKDGPTIAFLTEYDAVPGLGHGCGHNLIVLAAHGAALALRSVLAETGGCVVVIGAPAEETIGGKVVLAVRGAFDGVDAALLTHPGAESRASVPSLASWSVEVIYEGQSAHALAARERGVNALDAMIRLFIRRDLLLAEMDSLVRMPGVILEGGVRPNLVPDRARARFSLRAGETGQLVEQVLPRFTDLVNRVASEAGARAQIRTIDNLYDEMISNPSIASIWSRHARDAGLLLASGPGRPVASLDMGTLSYQVPSLHPTFAIADEPIATHTSAFVEASNAPRAYRAALQASRALALTGLDLLVDRGLLAEAKKAHEVQIAGRPPRVDAKVIDRSQEA